MQVKMNNESSFQVLKICCRMLHVAIAKVFMCMDPGRAEDLNLEMQAECRVKSAQVSTEAADHHLIAVLSCTNALDSQCFEV